MEIFQEFKIIWSYLKKYKRKVWSLTFLAMTASTILAFIPYFYGRLVDLVSIQPSELNFIFVLLGIWILMSLSSAFLTRIVNQRGSSLGINCFNNLICESSSHIIALPLRFHKEKKIGEIFSRIGRAAEYLLRIINEIIF